MKIYIPFTKKYLVFRSYKGASVCNGNGRNWNTLELSIIARIGNGDDGLRGIKE
jgi:hypothetical protein